MKFMSLNEIRSRFLKFYEDKGHYVGSSYSLVPHNDKSLLLINAGMAPLKNYFMGIEEPPKSRMATCQKCIRTGDIENVGITSRHATFFEMLGNFSFGDYFKHETIRWGWEFITKELEMPTENLWPTVYLDDDEAFDIWVNEIGVPAERVVRLGKEDNFWEIAVGPCGPCSEIHYDRGPEYGCDKEDCKPGCDCDRYVEFWNHVFTQFEKDENGEYHPLENPNIDTGMGLERIACLMQDVDTIFEVDTIKHILDAVTAKAGVEYGVDDKQDISIRIVTDHIRAVSFLVCDGVMPNNEGRGYVLRRLLRRAARHGKLLGIQGNFLTDLVDQVIEVSAEAYPELEKRKEYIKRIVAIEEDRFQATIDQGLQILNEYVADVEAKGGKELSGELAFKLYDTYGFPLDLTIEIIADKGLSVNHADFEAAMEAQRDRARSARNDNGDLGWDNDVLSHLETATSFLGYADYQADAKVLALVHENKVMDTLSTGQSCTIIVDQTPFYAEGGGQVGDRGSFVAEGLEIKITDTKKGNRGIILHHGEVIEGTVKTGMKLTAKVDESLRLATARNHTTTHILHKALRDLLGGHVEQAGSLVNEDRLRFDFSHFEGMTREELDQIEAKVNQIIMTGFPVHTAEMSIDEAMKKGAMALFGEKYGSDVRVVTVGDYSTELCGGTHLSNASQAGMFKIVSETGVAAGIRRIEAITGFGVFNYLNNLETTMHQVADALKSNMNDLTKKATTVLEELKTAQRENDQLKREMASGSLDAILDSKETINGINLLTAKFDDMDIDVLRDMGDQVKQKVENAVIVFANVAGPKVVFIAMANDDAIKAGAHAGNIVREVAKVAGGGGGGRPNMAQAGGKDPSKAAEALQAAKVFLESL